MKKLKTQKPAKNYVTVDRREVIDSKVPMLLKVEQCDIDKAVPGDPSRCVLALAGARQYENFIDQIKVGLNVAKTFTKERIIRYTTPPSLRKALRNFDKKLGWELPPGDYTLHPMTPSHALGYRAKRKTSWIKRNSGGTQSKHKSHQLPTRILPKTCIRRSMKKKDTK